ncbi:MAG TPA: dihydrolipoamide acetyltransferase family protein [Conexibacter sp.]
MPEVTMPRLSDSMEEGTIVRWLKRDGDFVQRGEPIVEIETDKATLEHEADATGVLQIVVGENETVPLGQVIAAVLAPGEAPASVGAPTNDGVATGGGDNGGGANGVPPRSAVNASPVARRFAAGHGLALAAMRGTGPHGRILKADVRRALAATPTQAAAQPPLVEASTLPMTTTAQTPASSSAVTPPAAGEPLTRVQATVARRMSEAKATIPDFWASVDVDLSAAIRLREQLAGQLDPAPSLNDVVVRACGVTLRRHPRLNASYVDGALRAHERVNIGIAVATDDDALVVPTVLDADQRSLSAIARDTRRLAQRVREGTVTPPELSGGTFTVSNLGMLGLDAFGGVINPPQAAILCVGAARRTPAFGPDGEVVAAMLASFTLVSDHRVVYGAHAARFLADLRSALQDPLPALV